MKRNVLLIIFVLCLSFVSLANDPTAIIVTPPAPKFTDAERQTELAKRRTAVFAKMLPDSLMILWSAEPRNYAGDVDFMYRQENNLYYLSNLRQKGAILILLKNGTKTQEILFLPPRNPANETWNGKMYSRDDAQRISGVKTVLDDEEFLNFDKTLREKKVFTSQDGKISANLGVKNLYLMLPSSEFDSQGMAEFRREFQFAESLKIKPPVVPTKKVVGKKAVKVAPPVEPKSIFAVQDGKPIVEELRHVKSPYEIKLLQHAIDITTEAQMRAMGMVGRANWEYEVQAEVEYTFRRRNADYWGYPSIVGCGGNATTLHYIESQSEIKKGDLLLMDVGAEYDHYTADVTRTFPVNGKFTKEQAEIYQIVYDAQEAAAKTIRPGASFFAASLAAEEVIKDGLFKVGLITDKNTGQHQFWYMHGWGHWLGMNVHDVGDYSVAFKPGMVMTNEPGIYIRGDALDYLPDTPANREFIAKIKPAFEKYKNIGVRIEDDMLVTETGVEWMTKKLPRKIDEVESFMEKAKQEMAFVSLKSKVQSPKSLVFDIGH